jgi:hypothetical protein
MSDPTPVPRRYTDEEVRHLLERAAEVQHAELASPEASGLTLADLEEVAREAGIDVGALRRAAEELEVTRSHGVDAGPGGALAHAGRRGGRVATLAGAPLSVVLERTLPVEVPRDALEALVPILQAAADGPGQSSVAGHTLNWRARHPTNLRELQVLLASRSGETRIWIEERYGGLAGTIFGSGVGGVGAGVGFGVGLGVGVAIGSTLMIVGFPLALLGGTYLGSRALYSGIVRGRRPELERLLATLTDEITATAESGRS